MRPIATLALLGLAACGTPNQTATILDAPLWSPTQSVATVGGLYTPLAQTGNLVWIDTGGDASLVAIRPGVLTRLSTTPDGLSAVAFVQEYACEPDEGRVPNELQDCAQADRVTSTRIALITEGDIDATYDVAGHFNTLEFSDTGRFAISWPDLDSGVPIEGVVNLNNVLVIDTESGEAWPVPVGFAADNVVYNADETRAIVLSRSEVAVLDLTTQPPTRSVTFPLTLDPDDVVVPVGISLTADGRYALISVQGRGDLYVLDLVNPSVNLVSLAGNPSAMVVDAALDETLITYSNTPRAEVLDHQFFDTELIELDEPMDQILQRDSMALLWRLNTGHDAYRLDMATLDLVEYRLENPVIQMHLAPTGEYALALTRAEGGSTDAYDTRPGMEILDLRPGEDDSFAYLLEGQGVGAAFVQGETTLDALVLQQGVDYLYRLDMYTLQPQQIDLVAPPVAIGAVPEGPFWIAHDDPMGLVSFFDPSNDRLVEVSGFATLGLLDEIPVTEVP